MAPAVVGSGGQGVVGVAVIGCGRIGQVHCKALSTISSAKVVVVADFFEKAAIACAESFGIQRYTKDWKLAVSGSDVDAVLICSPSNTHCDIIIESARQGKHIFVEKPIDYEIPRIDQALAAVASAGVKLQVGFQRRFDANFMRVKKAVSEGEIGHPFMLSITSRDPAPPPIEYVKQSGGILYDMAIHDMDMARFVMGCEAVEISTMAASFSEEISAVGDYTTVIISIRFENGAIGAIQCCRKAVYGYDQRIEVLGSSGAVEIGNNYPNAAVVSTTNGISRDLPLNFFMDRYAEAYGREIHEFIGAIVNNTPTKVQGIDGKQPVLMALAATKSLQEGRTVKLSEVMYSSSKL
uniref:Inositol 2-dehydrogenase n=1 Tax=Timspurckia oligopyrenoides TaxID=708627 RepID=A0A7S1ER13_9RHOD|mmetsp:Transcript_13706/g.24583  ORF Transcript_13706/g.24583 Transcript_13706/m.24583 type:complete len:352 (+) Transcript_13706:91-1146(+)|eukprot:CAMPEP_0182442462 /NCGR_PEP_ID=MMETSP1172-20130603/1377_1 /TAXON_ID=708627 /ORGANISM="Timspurckia oligopyrenoides, Strain CCMP3278" /LENGTH=351 /DNA_ID=CAMNT_0024637333 /DNA_START=79 /DNA_END=1134 /DNA_ORIENTATION=+